METKEIILPDGWEVKEVKGNKIILKEAERKGLPKTFSECWDAMDTDNISTWSIDTDVPIGMAKPVKALCQLLICRNAWWKQLGWKPDWEDKEVKYCIGLIRGKIMTITNEEGNRILAFPSSEIRDQFLESFRDLIEDAKELL